MGAELDYQAIGKRVKNARLRSQLTQEELAEKAGLSVTHMSNIETGHSKLSLPMAVALANTLHVSVNEFLCDNVICSKETFSIEALSYISKKEVFRLDTSFLIAQD